MRPCTCDNCKVGEPWRAGQCWRCWVYHNKPAYRLLWDGGIPAAASPTRSPGLIQKAVNFGKAVVAHAASGFKAADKEVYDERVRLCRSCDKFDGKKGTCQLCGCAVVAIKAKWAEQKCPDGKW